MDIKVSKKCDNMHARKTFIDLNGQRKRTAMFSGIPVTRNH